MCRARDGPLLRSTEAIDSIHIDMNINVKDLERFCKDQGLKFERGKVKNWQRESQIFLAGDPINVTYSFRSRNYTFEFGGIRNYNIYSSAKKLQFIRTLLNYFSDRSWSISRLDYAVDANISWDSLLPDFQCSNIQFEESTIYFNRRSKAKKSKQMSTLVIYDKGRQLNLFSTPLTRIELRLMHPVLQNRKLTSMFESKATLEKTATLIKKMLDEELKLFDVYGKQCYQLELKVLNILHEFLSFLHGDAPTIYHPDPFRIQWSMDHSARIRRWMEEEGVSPHRVQKHIRGKKLSVCKSLGIRPETFDKAVSFFKVSYISEL